MIENLTEFASIQVDKRLSNLENTIMMDNYDNRYYRNFSPTHTTAFRVTVGQSDLFIRATRDLSTQARDALQTCRYQIERYIQTNVAFDLSLEPLPADDLAPPICQKMLAAGQKANVGPFAAVAGAIANAVAEKLSAFSDDVIVENGGDLCLRLTEDMVVGVYAGRHSPFSGEVGFRIRAKDSPCALCTSSGTVGTSFSRGIADAVTVFAKDAALADAAATAICNNVQTPECINAVARQAHNIEGVLGVAIFIGDKMAVWGDLELVNPATKKEEPDDHQSESAEVRKTSLEKNGCLRPGS